jgi:hypothetical protein
MHARRDAVALSGTRGSNVVRKNRHLKFVGAILVVFVLLILATPPLQPDSNAALAAAPQSGVGTDATSVIGYFPARFPSPSDAAEEHIQAF